MKNLLPKDLDEQVRRAVAHFWRIRSSQAERQRMEGKRDKGTRGEVTGGSQMDGFISLIAGLSEAVGVPRSSIHYKKALELPGFFRPTKEWDLLVVFEGRLLAAIEVKSQVGPSFGNNFNNRTEEAMGSALDIWTAYREHAFKESSRPWLGYLFLLEDCERSQKPVRVREPHFAVFPEFQDASYARRYELFCRKLVLERHYSSAAFLVSDKVKGISGAYTEPAPDLGFRYFVRSLIAHLGAHVL